MPIIKNCLKCDTPIKVKPSKAERTKFCSKNCSYDYRKNNPEKYPRKDIKEKVSCNQCQKTIIRNPSEIRENNYCSKECFDEFRRGKEVKEKQNRVTLQCGYCEKDFDVVVSRETEAKFCSKKCTSQYLAKKFKKEHTPNTECSYCQTPIYRKPCLFKTLKRFFCNRECNVNWQKENSNLVSGENSVHWNGGKIEYYGPNWRQQRRKARERDNYACHDCGKTEEELGQELSVHHKMPFVFFDDYKEANQLNNLVCLCEIPCHRKRHSGDGHPSKFKEGKRIKI